MFRCIVLVKFFLNTIELYQSRRTNSIQRYKMKRITNLLLIIVCLFMAACASPATTTPKTDGPKTPQALQPTAVSTALFQVIKPDGTSVGVTVADLKTLPLKQVTVEGKTEEGPGLLDVLKFAGVTEFSEVSLSGSSSPATLKRDQVDDNTILDFTNHGTVKLATTYIPKPNWTKDVSKIEVKK